MSAKDPVNIFLNQLAEKQIGDANSVINDGNLTEDHFDKDASLFTTQKIGSTKLKDIYGNPEGRPGDKEPTEDLEVNIENGPLAGPCI